MTVTSQCVSTLLFVSLAFSLVASGEGKEEAFRVFGYVPEYRHSLSWDSVTSVVTDVIFFSLSCDADGEVTGLDRFPAPDVLEAARKQDTNVMICVGGSGRTGHFASMGKTSRSRAHFVEGVVDLLVQHQLSGVDLNWTPMNEVEWAMMSKLLQLFREKLDQVGQGLTLTVSLHPQPVKLTPPAMDAVDFFLIMAYDIPHSRVPPMHHSTRELARRIDSLESLVGKAVLGVPFYGRHVMSGEARTYAELVRDVPAINPHDDIISEFFFNGLDTVSWKTRLAVDSYRGLMIWELGQDELGPLSLLSAIERELASSHVHKLGAAAAGSIKRRAAEWKASHEEKHEL